jgi:hypothetical protein
MQPTGTLTTEPHVLRNLDQPPAATIANVFGPVSRAWRKSQGAPHVPSGRERADAALKLIAIALKSLGKRRGGAREDAARQWLDATAAAITAAISAFETIGEDCDGPAALAHVARLGEVRAQRDAAQMALDAAESTATMRAAREALDSAAVAQRAFDRELRELVRAATLPTLPDPRAFADAEQQTAELARAAKQGKRPATTLAEALAQGAAAAAPSDDPGAVARATLTAKLWVAYEAEPAAADVFAWRHARYIEGRPEPKPVEDAPSDPLSLSYAQTKALATLLVDAEEIAQLKWPGLSDDQVRTLSRAGLLRDEQRADWEARP